MSQIKKVTDFLKNDIPELHKTADELHGFATTVKGRAMGVMGHVKGEFEALDKELMELQAALGLTTNGPPTEEA